jgi:hypothetical protein
LIYGALYVTFAYVTIYAIGTLGYNPAAAGLIGIPSSILLVLFSTRFGKLAARHGPRLFMALGPALMGVGILWFARLPPSSEPWVFELRNLSTWLPPSSYLVDMLPAYLVFGAGLTIMVAPLTTALMTSVPKENSGVASAVNNAISRVGPQLAGALIFVAIASSFYNGIASRVPGLDTSTSAFRTEVAPLNRPPEDAPDEVKEAALASSTDAFHVGMYFAAALLFAGALVNGIWIKNPRGPAWMRHPRGVDSQAVVRMGTERAGQPQPAPSQGGKAPPWMDGGT